MEALRFQIVNTALTGGVQGNAHVQSIGWTGWERPTRSSARRVVTLRLEAVQLRLTSQLAANFDLAYRVHVQNIGWMPWVKNGATAGTTGRACASRRSRSGCSTRRRDAASLPHRRTGAVGTGAPVVHPQGIA